MKIQLTNNSRRNLKATCSIMGKRQMNLHNLLYRLHETYGMNQAILVTVNGDTMPVTFDNTGWSVTPEFDRNDPVSTAKMFEIQAERHAKLYA